VVDPTKITDEAGSDETHDGETATTDETDQVVGMTTPVRDDETYQVDSGDCGL
jgi:hypothetical protein